MPTGPDTGPRPYEIHIPNDFEPIDPNVTEPRERARLESERLVRYLRSERSNEVRGTWSNVEFSGEYACSTGVIFGRNYDLQVPPSGEAVVQKYEGGAWVRVGFPTPDRTANLGLQMRIAELRKAAADRAGGTAPTVPTTPTTTVRPTADTAPTGGETVGARQPIDTIPGGLSQRVRVGATWYDVTVLSAGSTEFYAFRNNRWERTNPTGDLLKVLEAEAATVRRGLPSAPTTTVRPTVPTTPTTETAPTGGETVGARQPVDTIPGGLSRRVSVAGTWYDVTALNNGTTEFYTFNNNRWERTNPTGNLLKVLQAEAAAMRGTTAPTTTVRPTTPVTPDRPTTPTTPDGPPATELAGRDSAERAVNAVLALRFPEGVSYRPNTGEINHYLRANHVEDPQNYVRHMTAAAENLRAAIGARPGARGAVTIDGSRMVFTNQAGDLRLVANAQFVLRDRNPGTPRSPNFVIDQGPSAGVEVRFSPNGPTFLNGDQQRQTANYDVVEIPAPGGGTALYMYGRDGSLRQVLVGSTAGSGFSPSEVRSYSGQGDPRNPRPSVIRALSPTTVRLPSRDGAPTTSDYRLSTGTHYVPETGEPVRSYAEATDPSGSRQARRTEYRRLLNSGRTAEAADMKRSLDAELNANLEGVRGWMRNLVTACRGNPKAMTEAVTGVMTFTARTTGEGIGTVSGRDRVDRGADLQSPELTVFLGGGHCKDFAFLLQHLCTMGQQQYPGTGGARTLVMATHDTHSSTYYVQEVPRPGGGRGYRLVKMHVLGYEEGPVVDSAEAALAQVWERGRSSHATAFDHARALGDRNAPSGEGVVVFDAPASPTANEASFGYNRYNEVAAYLTRPMR